MPESWPGGIPTYFLEEGYAEQWADNTIETVMDVGPPKARRRSTAAPWTWQGSMIMTTAQVATFRTFYDTTVSQRSETFTITHPRSGSSITCRFASPPTIEGGQNGNYKVSLNFLVLP